MTARPTEQDVRAALPARAVPRTWDSTFDDDDPVGNARPGVEHASYPARHPGLGRAVLACSSCGHAMDAEDMRRAIPPRPIPANCTVIRPIVCPLCTPTARSNP